MYALHFSQLILSYQEREFNKASHTNRRIEYGVNFTEGVSYSLTTLTEY